MEKGVGWKADPADLLFGAYYREGSVLDEEQLCKKENLIVTRCGVINRCRCGIYHVRISSITLHLTETQFEGAARLFKLALGIVEGE